MAIDKKKSPAPPELHSEAASRLKDPHEQTFMGVLRTNDSVLVEQGMGNYSIYRRLKLDGKVFDGLQKRTLALVGYEWMIEPVSKTKDSKDAALLTEALKRCNFDQVCKDLLESLLMGMAVVEIVWTVRDGWVVPERIIKRKTSRFVFVQTDEHKPPELRLLTKNNMVVGEALPERKFIVRRVNAEDDNPYGNGLGAQSYWPVFFKRKGIVAWNKLIDRFGTPTAHGKHPRDATPKEKSTLMDALRAMSNDGALITPEGMEVALLESKLTGSISAHNDLCRYMDEWLDAVWLGKETSDGSGGAQAAAAKERSDIRLALTKGDADLLSGTLNETLLKWICEYNGWEPCHVYRQIKEETDIKVESETDKNVSEMGFELSEDGVRAKYGEYWSKKAAPEPAAPFADVGAMDKAFGEVRMQKLQPAANDPQAKATAQTANFAEMAQAQHELDALDVLVRKATDEWEPLLDPMLAPIEQMLAEAAARGETAQQVLERLPEVLQHMDDQPLHNRLTKTGAIAQAAGAAGIEV